MIKQNSKFLLVFLALGFLFACARAPQQLVSEKPVAPVVDLTSEKIRDSIVLIESEKQSGAGFFVALDMIATNIHSVAHPGPAFVKSPDKEKDWAIEGVVGFDAKNSLVILKLAGEGKPLPLADRVQIGTSVSIPGYRDGEFKVVEGKIQSIRNNNKWLRIKATKETDGSPVLSNNGQVIGVIVPYGSYAVPSSALAALLDTPMPIEPFRVWQQRKQVRAAAYYSLGIDKSDAKDYAGALVNFDKAIELNPAYIRAHYERGRAQFYLGDYDSGIASLTQIIKIDPEDADAYYGRGTVKVLFGDYTAAIVDFDKTIELEAQHANAYRNRGGVKFRLGESESARGNTEAARRLYEAAMADCEKAIQIDPEDADAYNGRGATKLALDDFEGALLDFSKVIELDPEHTDAYSNRGAVKFRLGESEAARGNAEAAQRLYEETIADCNKAIRLNPKDVHAYNNRGLAKFELGDSEGAILDFNRTVQIDPEHAHAYDNRGRVRSHLGESASDRGEVEKARELYKTAVEDYTQVVKINPEDADTYNDLATAKCKFGDIESVLGAAKKAQALYREGIADYDKYIQLNNPEDADTKTANLASEKGRNSTVRVMTWTGNFSNGSGFFVDKDKVVTNIHVVVNPGPVFVKLMDRATIWAVEEVTAFDVENDLAILKIVGEGPPLPIGNSDMIQIGEPVVAVGYPDGRYKVTTGVIDSIQNSGRLIRMKVATSGGNSGGPALNSRDEVIGIVAAGSDLYSFANPSNPLKSLLTQPESSEPLEKWRGRDCIRAYGYFIQGQWKLKSNRYKEALTDFENAIKLNPTFIYTYRWRGDAKVALGNYKEAVADYNKAIQLNPDDADAYRNQGHVHFHLATSESASGNLKKAQGLYEGAIENWTQAIKLAPEYADVYSNRGHTKAILGDYEGAIIDFDKAIQINPEFAVAYYNRGRAKEALGQKEAAKADFQKAKELNPNVGQ